MKNKKIMAFLRNAGIMAVLFAATQNAAAWGAYAEFTVNYNISGISTSVMGGVPVSNLATEAEARSQALSTCNEARDTGLTQVEGVPGSSNARATPCQIVHTFQNKCIGPVIGFFFNSQNRTAINPIFTAFGDTINSAQMLAKQACLADTRDTLPNAPNHCATFEEANINVPNPEIYCDSTSGSGENTETGEVEVFSLGGITRMAVRNGTRQEVVYEIGEWFEPENSDNQRMMVTERTVVRAGGLSDVPVACQQIGNSAPTRNAQYSSARPAETDSVSQCQLRCLDGDDVQSCVWRCETRDDADTDFRTVAAPTIDNFPAEVTPIASPQEVGTDIPNVDVRGLGTIRQLAVRNNSDSLVTYLRGDYLEPKDGDVQRMMITETTRVAAGEAASIPVVCRQREMDTPAEGVTFYSMPRAVLQDNLASARQGEASSAQCQLNCLDNASDIQACVWRCETQPEAAVREFTTPSPSVETIDSGSTTNTGGSSGSGGGSSNTGLIIGGVAVVGGLIWFLSSGGEEGEFNFSHDFGYSATESGYSANIGGQMDFRKDNWHLYFSGDGSIDGKFRYQSGGSYTADFWTARFSESVSGKTADYDLSLSSNFGGGIWNISPTYRLHSEYADSEFDTQNSLNLESEFRYNNWEIRPTAGFNWREFGEFADSGTFRINAVHHF